MASRLKSYRPWLGAIWIYWWTRLHQLDSLPIFLDEAAHIWWARLAWEWQPFHAASDGRLLNVLWAAVFWPFNGSVWVTRAATVLLTTVGFAALLTFARRFLPPRAATVTAVTYIIVPFTLFFERMQLPDTYATACSIILLWSSAELARSPNRRINIIIVGLALVASLLSKITSLVFVPVPALAALMMGKGDRWRSHASATLRVYLLAGAMLVPVLVVLHTIAHSDLGLDLLARKTSNSPAEMWSQAQITGPMVWNYFQVLFTPWLWWLSLLAIAISLPHISRVSLYICATAMLGMVILIAKSNPNFLEARFALPYVAFLILLTANGTSTLWKYVAKQGTAIRITAIILGLLSLFPSGKSMWNTFQTPEELELPDRDTWEYIRGWPSGYGFREIATQFNERNIPTQLLTFDLGGQQRIAAYLPHGSQITPVWVPPEKFHALQPEVGTRSLLVLDHPKDDANLAELRLELRPIRTYPRPLEESWLTVYELEIPIRQKD